MTSIEETYRELGSSPHGLSSEEASKRLATYGKNVLHEQKINRWKIFFRQFNNILIYILFAASLISISIGELTDFFVINVIIFINGFIAFWQELKAETSIAALKKLTETRCKVMRDGAISLIPSSELVPGDFLILHEGEMITADIRLVESSGVMVDESSMTGESIPVTKDHTVQISSTALPFELKNMLLAGTAIVRGAGRGVVVKTGSQTYLAKIAEKSQEISPATPLTKALKFFSQKYVVLLILLFVTLGVIGILQGRTLIDLGYILIASLVSAVPEGLPIVITIVMVLGAVSLSKKKALIRYLPSVETLGSATVIASDKTGTITEGKLIVSDTFALDPIALKTVAALCNDSHAGVGDPLDVALADWVDEYETIRKKHPRKWGYSFDTRLMLMATVNEMHSGPQLFVKGAYESLREKVKNSDELEKLDTAFNTLLKKGLRVLAFGIGEWKSENPSLWNIQIIGLIGFLDPPKKNVREAVMSAEKAGVRVIMITGDHPMTAKAIAQEVGIWKTTDQLLTGHEIEKLTDDQLSVAIKKTSVFARILPEHKYRIVKLLQAIQEIVAVTGDGVNDVPALKTADIGIAMGSGTEAAKSASKMVITDNDLSIIVSAIRNARLIADNIRKVIYYLISTSMQEIFLISLSIINSLPLPLTAIHILWINIVTDGVQDKTFAFAKAEGNLMQRKPRRPDKQFFDLKQLINIVIFSFGLGIAAFIMFKHLLNIYPYTVVTTIMFTSVVVAQWANGIQAQKESEPFFKNIRNSFTINPYIYLGAAMGALLQCFAIYIAPQLFHSTPLTLQEWKYPALIFLAAFGIVELRKWVFYFTRKYNS